MIKQENLSGEKIQPIRGKWKGTLTDRQRFNRQMHYKPVDRCFNMEFGYWKENFTKWPIFYENNITNDEDAELFFNFDRIAGIQALWMNPPYREEIIEQTKTCKRIVNSEGLLVEVPLDGHDTIPHIISSSIIKPQDWNRCKQDHFNRDDPQRKIDIGNLKKLYPASRDFPLGVDCGSMIGVVRNMLTFEGLAYAVYDYPDMVEDMVETFCVLIEDFLDQILGEIDFDFASGWEDICFKSGPIVSVDFFKNVVVPRYKRINKKLKAYGIDIWYTDCDGDVRPILPLLIESGINCLFPFEVNCCTHPGRLLDEYGKELRIMGGFDKMALGDGEAAIKKYMESLVPYVERGGYIPFCDHRCPPNVKHEDYIYYLDLKEQMFGMK
ncbi:MAG: uroporphyrinogen decarboxylase family protein [Phycisphaerae bacterium]|jgi:uroporphyrinogen decarboxylase